MPFSNKTFAGTGIYTAEDMPEIDYLLITHDHWDHLDQPTVIALQPKIRNMVCGLGVGIRSRGGSDSQALKPHLSGQ